MKRLTLFLLLIFCGMAYGDPRLWGSEGLAVQQGGRIEWNRSAAVSADDFTVVVWSDMHTGNREIYGQMMSPLGDMMWPEGGLQITNELNEQSQPLVVATDGGWVIAWVDYRFGRVDYYYSGDIYAQKLDEQGIPQWGPGGIIVDSTASMMRGTLSLLSDHDGGAIVSWVGHRQDSFGICAQRLNADGQPTWPDLVMVPESIWNTNYVYFRAAEDDSGGMVLVWDYGTYDFRFIHATRITGNGQLPWGNVVISQRPGTLENNPVICSDSSGGCYIAWSSWVVGSDNSDVYAQRLDAAGTALWAENGAPVCDAPLHQYDVLIAPSLVDGANDGCLFSWHDYRGGYYAQMLLLDGTPLWEVNGISISPDMVTSICGDGEGGVVAVALGSGVRAAHLNTFGESMWPESLMPVYEVPSSLDYPLVIPQSGSFLFLFQRTSYYYNEDLRGIKAQRLEALSGLQVFAPEGVSLADYGYRDANLRRAIPMSENRTALIFSGVKYQIIDSDGQRVFAPDSLIELPDTTFWQSLEFADASPDGSGGFFVVSSQGGDESGIQSYLSHVLASGALANDNPVQISEVANDWYVYNAVVSADGQGGAYVVFRISHNPEFGTYVLRFDSDCQQLWDAAVMLDNEQTISSSSIVTQPNGHCTFVWRPWRWEPGPDSVVRMVDVDPDGTIFWNIGICDSSTHADTPHLYVDGQNGAYCVWADTRGGSDRRIYAQHVNANGVKLWDAAGIPVWNANFQQLEWNAIVDPSGNLIVTWVDQIDNTNENIWAQKLSPEGDPMWAWGGLVVCDAPLGQFSPRIVTDGEDGCFITWEDYREYGPDLYGTHLNALGAAGPDLYWIANAGGMINDTLSNLVTFMDFAPGPDGTALAFWTQDLRQSESAGQDLFAQRITALNLDAGEPPVVTPQRYALRQNYPNPFNPVTEIAFTLPAASKTTLSVFDLLGREVATLVERTLTAGEYRIPFDAAALPSGMYFYRLAAGPFTSTRKMVVLK